MSYFSKAVFGGLLFVFSYSVFAQSYSDDPNAAQDCADAGQDYAAAVKFVQALQKIIQANDAKSFAQLGDYPVTINYGQATSHSIQIQTPQALVAQYNHFITPSMKQGILTQPNISCTQDGVMVYYGAIWFDTDGNNTKFYVINSDASS